MSYHRLDDAPLLKIGDALAGEGTVDFQAIDEGSDSD